MKTVPVIHCPYCDAYYTPQQFGVDFKPGIRATVICGVKDSNDRVIGCGKQFDFSIYEENVLEDQDIVEEKPKPGLLNKILRKKHAVKVGTKSVVVGKKLSATVKQRNG